LISVPFYPAEATVSKFIGFWAKQFTPSS